MSITLKIVTPAGIVGPLSCDSVRLTLSDDLSERGGGSFGIREGHSKSLLSLMEGPMEALMEEKTILKGRHGEGFATIENNEVKIIAECFEKE